MGWGAADHETGAFTREPDSHERQPVAIPHTADPQGGPLLVDPAAGTVDEAHVEGITPAPATPIHDPDDESMWVYQDTHGTYLPIPPDAETMCGCMWGVVKEPHPAYLKLMAKRHERELEKYEIQLALNRKRAREQGDTDGSWGA